MYKTARLTTGYGHHHHDACLSSTEGHSVGPPGRTPSSPSIRLPCLLVTSLLPPFFFNVLHRGTNQRARAGPAQQDSPRRGRALPAVSRIGTSRWDTRGALLVSRMLPVEFDSNFSGLWCNATVLLLLLSVSEVFSSSPCFFLISFFSTIVMLEVYDVLQYRTAVLL